MIKAPIILQDLRRRIYVEAKAEMFCGFRTGNFRASAGGGGVGMGCSRAYRCAAAVGYSIFFRKSLRRDRSHKPWGEANKKAQCGKSARWV
jgi:hypothetical protein